MWAKTRWIPNIEFESIAMIWPSTSICCRSNEWRPGLDYVLTVVRVMGGVSNIRAINIHQTVVSLQEYDIFNVKNGWLSKKKKTV